MTRRQPMTLWPLLRRGRHPHTSVLVQYNVFHFVVGFKPYTMNTHRKPYRTTRLCAFGRSTPLFNCTAIPRLFLGVKHRDVPPHIPDSGTAIRLQWWFHGKDVTRRQRHRVAVRFQNLVLLHHGQLLLGVLGLLLLLRRRRRPTLLRPPRPTIDPFLCSTQHIRHAHHRITGCGGSSLSFGSSGGPTCQHTCQHMGTTFSNHFFGGQFVSGMRVGIWFGCRMAICRGNQKTGAFQAKPSVLLVANEHFDGLCGGRGCRAHWLGEGLKGRTWHT